MEALRTDVAFVGLFIGMRLAVGDEGGYAVKRLIAHLSMFILKNI